nr:hypothetical protein [Tanacetum cinerariifolium]
EPPDSLPYSCNMLPIHVHQSLHMCLLANHIAQLELEHLSQLVYTETSFPLIREVFILFCLSAFLSKMIKFLAIKTLNPRLLHYRTAYIFPSPSNIHRPLIPKLSSLIVILIPWSHTYEKIDEHELEAYYSYMVKNQEVPTADIGTDSKPLEKVQNVTRYNVFANDLQHSEQSESISNTCIGETNDSNAIPDSPDMCDDDIQNDQNDVECDDEHVALAKLIANLKLDVNENKKIQKQLKKANTTLDQELKECKTILAKTSKTLGESNSVRDSCLVALQNKKLSLRNIRPLMTVPLTMINLNAQSEMPCLYAFPYNQSTHANRLIPDGEVTLALEIE